MLLVKREVMTIASIKIRNVLSFENIDLNSTNEIVCFVGKNNTGKSNLAKVIEYFYLMLSGEHVSAPSLYSNYSYSGSIEIRYDVTRLFRISLKRMKSSSYFEFVFNNIISKGDRSLGELRSYYEGKVYYSLKLEITSRGVVRWSERSQKVRNVILHMFPFFYIDARRIKLHDWDQLWDVVHKIKTFNLSSVDSQDVINFFDDVIPSEGAGYRDYLEDIANVFPIKKESKKKRLLAYIKSGLDGTDFHIDHSDLDNVSDGTSSYNYIISFLKVIIRASRSEYISPLVFVDEPELGLHPNKNELFVRELSREYRKYTSKSNSPKIFLVTHSPAILREVIKSLRELHSVVGLYRSGKGPTRLNHLRSSYPDKRFVNIFSDNEARLFFSNFIFLLKVKLSWNFFLMNRYKKGLIILNIWIFTNVAITCLGLVLILLFQNLISHIFSYLTPIRFGQLLRMVMRVFFLLREINHTLTFPRWL